MARAGYDPRDMANMFQTIQAKGGGSGGPEWMSSHPNPGNRYEAITRKSAQLRVTNPVRNTAEFTQVKSRLQRMAPAPTTEQVMKQGGGGNRRTGRDDGVIPRVRSARSSRPLAGIRPSTAATSSASRCRRTGASCRATTR